MFGGFFRGERVLIAFSGREREVAKVIMLESADIIARELWVI